MSNVSDFAAKIPQYLPQNWSINEEDFSHIKSAAYNTTKALSLSALASGYMLAGVSLISAGIWIDLFAVTKTIQYFTLTSESAAKANTSSSWRSSANESDLSKNIYGFGSVFEVPCSKILGWIAPSQGQEICESMSQKTWADVSKPPYPALDIASTLTFAVAFPLSVFNISWFMLASGFSLMQRSLSLYAQVFKGEQVKKTISLEVLPQ